MRTRMLSGLLIALACACGDDGDPTLEGTWGAADSDGCKTALLIEGDSYEEIFACALTDGTIGYESYRGTFSKQGDAMAVSITHSSCPDTDPYEERLRYEFIGSRLRVSSDSGLRLFERIKGPTASSGTAVYGCYDGDDFDPSPVQRL